jgi:hypothetical protein
MHGLERFGGMGFLYLVLFLMMSSGTPAGENSGKSAPAGYSSMILQVKFREGTDVSAPKQLLPPELRGSVADITRLFSGLSKEKLDKMKAAGERSRGEKLPDLTTWFKITLKPGTNSAEFVEKLKRLDKVETVQYSPLVAPPPS